MNKVESGKSGKIESLQALRALAFTGIFLLHAEGAVEWSALSVSVFFVLSGFLMGRKYHATELPCSIKENVRFAYERIKGIYPLHMITMLTFVGINSLLYTYVGWTKEFLGQMVAEVICNTALIQSWVPMATMNASLNGVAWYLSTTVFLYFVFPYVLKVIKKLNTEVRLFAVGVLILVLQIVFCAITIHIQGWDGTFYLWSMYCFPLFRLSDFFIGCSLGYLTIKKEGCGQKLSRGGAAGMEIAALALTILVHWWIGLDTESFLLSLLKNKTTLMIPLAVLWVYLFFVCRGFITRVMTNPVLIFIGNLSPYLFLIHYVLTRGCEHLKNVMGWSYPTYVNVLRILLQYIISILLAWVYSKWKTSRKRGL